MSDNSDIKEGIEEGSPVPSSALIQPEPVAQPKKSSWNWIGSPSRPEAQKERDGVSDLFRVDFDGDMEDVNDIITVDVARDVVDAGHDGTLDDLVDVFPEDIMGVNSIGQKPSRKQLRQLRAERKARHARGSQSPGSGDIPMGGMQNHRG